MEKITVLMSVYNEEVYLKDAIESILNQTYKNFEFLIINDNSKDSSRNIMLSFNDPRIKLIDNQINVGLTCSLNKGIELSRTKYIIRQDADDISLPMRLEEMISFAQKNNHIAMLGSSYIHIDEEGKELEAVILETEQEKIREKLLFENHFGSELMDKASVVEIGGYNEEFKYAQDYELCLRLVEQYQFENIKKPLYKRRIHKDSISIYKQDEQSLYALLAKDLSKKRKNNGFTEKEELNYILDYKEKYIFPLKNKRADAKKMFLIKNIGLARFYFSVGMQNLLDNKMDKSRSRFLIAIKHNPVQFSVYIFYFLTFLPFGIIEMLRSIKQNATKIRVKHK